MATQLQTLQRLPELTKTLTHIEATNERATYPEDATRIEDRLQSIQADNAIHPLQQTKVRSVDDVTKMQENLPEPLKRFQGSLDQRSRPSTPDQMVNRFVQRISEWVQNHMQEAQIPVFRTDLTPELITDAGTDPQKVQTEILAAINSMLRPIPTNPETPDKVQAVTIGNKEIRIEANAN